MVMAVAQGAVWPVPPLGGVTPARRTPLRLGQAPVFNGCPGEACRGRRSGVLLAAVLSEGAASIASAGSFSAGSLEGHGRCGTPTQVRPEGCHHSKAKFAHLPLRATLVPELQQVPTLATLKCCLAPPGPVPRDPQVAIPVAPLHLAPTRRGSTPMGTPRRGIIPMGTPCQGITPMGTPRQGIIPMGTPHQDITPMGTPHRAPLTAIRSTIRSTRRSTPSTMEASTAAAQAAQAAVLTLTEEDISHPHGVEAMKREVERPMGTTCMLLHSLPLSLRAAFCLLSDFLVFSL
ncbi:uncharacterized protein LOC127018355 [Gymnogyps californianus]|uniref:uncharacterized protein LOC127018355 n=1 Tax=Gymnogyps californianus TaxID=33616 RepID=UPI0021C7191B|nr:uncharacterized protein LOC127018355 [Gymnogyps californianus]